MKNLTTLLLLLTSYWLVAQNVTIPDPNFKKALLNHFPKIDTNNDGEIQVLEAQNFSKDIHIDVVEDINNVKGLESFENTPKITFKRRLGEQNFTSLDFSKNKKLTSISFSNCKELTSVNFGTNNNLKDISFSFCSKLENINMQGVLNLEFVDLSSCNIKSLNISKHTKIKELSLAYNPIIQLTTYTQPNQNLSYLNVQNTLMPQLELDQLQYLSFFVGSNSKIKHLDFSKNKNIKKIYLRYSSIATLNLKNGNNTIITELNTKNTGIKVICVDDVNVAYNTPNWEKDATTYYSRCEECVYIGGAVIYNNWNNPVNWENDTPPERYDDALIPAGKKAYIKSLSKVVVQNLKVEGELNLIGQTSLIVEKNLSINEVTGSLNVKPSTTSKTSPALIVGDNTTGKINYYQHIPSTKWHFISSPLSNQNIDHFVYASDLAKGKGNNLGLAFYNNSIKKWQYYQDGSINTGNFRLGTGYAIKTKTIGLKKITGDLLSIDFNNLSITDNTSSGGNKWNLIGNPYLSYMAVNDNNSQISNNFLKENASQLNPNRVAIYIWDNDTESYLPINQTNTSALKAVAPGQGFFVEAKNGGGNLVITKAMQVGQGALFARSNTKKANAYFIEITALDGALKKKTFVHYINNATKGLDVGYDAGVFSGEKKDFEIYTNLVSKNNNTPFAIQALPNRNYSKNSIPLGISTTKNRNITLSSTYNLPDGYKVYLEDKKMHTIVLLDKKYTTTLQKNNVEKDRFTIYISNKTLATNNLSNTTEPNFFLQKNNLSLINFEGKTKVSVYNIIGKEVFSKTVLATKKDNISLPKKHIGIYIVRIKNKEKVFTKKILLNKPL